jgi:phenylpropionate dioxygenase-like ring-hydroxylating dioxygenase large terminal subunit
MPIEVKDESEWGCGFMYPASGSKSEETKLIGAGVGSTLAGSSHHGPNTLITRIYFNEEKKFHQYFFEAPQTDSSTKIFFVNMRTFMLEDKNDQMLIDVNMRIAGEDINVIENLDPVRTPDSSAKELLTPVDKPIFAYREYLDKWDAKGWRIDWRELQDKRGDVAFAIPSPARRTEKNWVLDTVPLMAPVKQSKKLKSA